MELARIIPSGIEVAYIESTDSQESIDLLVESGFLNLVRSERPDPEDGKRIVESYQEINGEIIQVWTVIDDKSLYLIEKLKSELSASDYKVLKCYESSLAGETLPYNFTQLHAERQALRDQINNLESVTGNL